MAPLIIETYNPKQRQWAECRKINPSKSDSIVQDNPDGTKDIYKFQCAADNSHSIVDCTLSYRDTGPEKKRSAGLIVGSRLEDGDSHSSCTRGIEQFRFTHKQE